MAPTPVPAISTDQTFRFGVFELDVKAEELRKAGTPVKLQPQPFRVLVMLVRNAGELVTRDSIRQEIWGSDTFVDFDQSLNFCIKQIRNVLGDEADVPRYVQTLHRRGYKFIAPVSSTGAAAEVTVIEPAEGPLTESGTVPIAVVPSPPAPLAETHLGAPTRRHIPLGWLIGMLVTAAVIGAGIYRYAVDVSNGFPRDKARLVVLPFDNLSGDQEQAYLTDGVTEEISAQLGTLNPAKLGVVARTAAMRYRANPRPLGQIGKELGVDYVLEGSVRRSGDRVRVTAQLIKMSDETHIWAQSYDGEFSKLIPLQKQVARDVARQLSLVVPELQQSDPERLIDPEAHDEYLRGRYLFIQTDTDSRLRGCTHFENAIKKDANYALAYVGTASCYEAMNSLAVASPQESMSKARAAIHKAMELDPNLPEAHAMLGLIYLTYDFDWAAADKELQAAIKLNPNYADAYRFYGTYLRNMGRSNEALVYLERAKELDPVSGVNHVRIGWTYGFMRDWKSALPRFEEARVLDPRSPTPVIGIWISYENLKNYDKAVEAWVDALHLMGRDEDAALAQRLYAEQGYAAAKKAVVKKQIERMLKDDGKPSFRPFDVAALYCDIGDRDNALRWMERAYAERNRDLYEIKVNPRFDVVREDPRFQDLLRRMNLQ
jgi:TolB-like protein/DNA-binding winged helix-turn-helix (wHTH) protein/Flp pilus assembly protein TadD